MVQKGEADYDESYEVDKAELKKWEVREGREARIPHSQERFGKISRTGKLYAKCKSRRARKSGTNIEQTSRRFWN